MRVSHPGNNPVHGTDASNVSKSKGTERGGRTDRSALRNEDRAERTTIPGSVKTDISARGKEFARAKEIASSAPDVREQKIAELKRRIAAGHYHVDADKIADKLVDEHLATGSRR